MDYTLKLDTTASTAYNTYYHQFNTVGDVNVESEAGETKSLPHPEQENNVGLAVYSLVQNM